MQEGKKRGCEWYDFLGIASEDTGQKHLLFGVSRFKKKFGGTQIQYAPAFEVVQRKGWDVVLRGMKKVKQIFY